MCSKLTESIVLGFIVKNTVGFDPFSPGKMVKVMQTKLWSVNPAGLMILSVSPELKLWET